MELERKVYTKEDVDAKATELGQAITSQLEQLLATGDLPTLASLISFRLGVAVMNHDYWSKRSDSAIWRAVVEGNSADILYQAEMGKLLSNEETKKLAADKQKALSQSAATEAYTAQGSAKAAKAENDVYKNFWSEWVNYLSTISDLARHVAMHKLVESKLNQLL